MATAGKVLIRIRGDWTSGTSYKVIDIVYFEGSSYIANKDIPNSILAPNIDSANWQLFAHGVDAENVVMRDMFITSAEIDNIDNIIVDSNPEDDIVGESITTNDIDNILNN